MYMEKPMSTSPVARPGRVIPAGEPGASSCTRRSLIAGAGALTMAAFVPALAAQQQSVPVTATEDLMREHGVLRRALQIYERAGEKLAAGSFPPQVLAATANIVREFVEDYHERLEEQYVFPRFERANQHKDLVQVLLLQHRAGREVTDTIRSRATDQGVRDQAQRGLLIGAMQSYLRMYRAHAAREDTELFPALRSVVSAQEFGAMGEEFERIERKRFGEDGFERIVSRLTKLEQEAGMPSLEDLTPRPPATQSGTPNAPR
jgi:hemerythrin-like domain-containing protein